jgi:hypothetical protein
LIEAFAASGYQNKQLRTLNCCRIRLHAITLAGITTGDGRHLLEGIFDGTNPMLDASPHTYPQQGQLPPAAWRLWKAALKEALQVGNDGRLAVPLGRWISREGDRTWPSWYDPTTSFIYLRQSAQPALIRCFWYNTGICSWFPSLGGQRYNGTSPLASVRASAWLTADNRLQMTGLARPMVAPDETGPTTLDEASTQLSADAQWAVEWFEQLGNTALLADGLLTAELLPPLMDRSRIDTGPRVSR